MRYMQRQWVMRKNEPFHVSAKQHHWPMPNVVHVVVVLRLWFVCLWPAFSAQIEMRKIKRAPHVNRLRNSNFNEYCSTIVHTTPLNTSSIIQRKKKNRKFIARIYLVRAGVVRTLPWARIHGEWKNNLNFILNRKTKVTTPPNRPPAELILLKYIDIDSCFYSTTLWLRSFIASIQCFSFCFVAFPSIAFRRRR